MGYDTVALMLNRGVKRGSWIWIDQRWYIRWSCGRLDGPELSSVLCIF